MRDALELIGIILLLIVAFILGVCAIVIMIGVIMSPILMVIATIGLWI